MNMALRIVGVLSSGCVGFHLMWNAGCARHRFCSCFSCSFLDGTILHLCWLLSKAAAGTSSSPPIFYKVEHHDAEGFDIIFAGDAS